MLLPNYVDGEYIYADTDDAGGGGINAWMAAINAATTAIPAGTVAGEDSTVTSASTLTLTISSPQVQKLTGTTTETVELPTTDVVVGNEWLILNQSTDAVTVQASGGDTVVTLAGGSAALLMANTDTPTGAADWDCQYWAASVASGKLLTVDNSLELAGTDGTTMTFPGSSDTVATLGAIQTLTWTTLAQLILATTTSSASALALTNEHSTYVYTGSAATTWVLTGVLGNTGMQLFLYNRGSGTVTVQTIGTDHLYDGAKGAVTSITIAAGGSVQLFNDGTYWLVVVAAAAGSNKYSGTITGAGTFSDGVYTYTVTHNLGTEDVVWSVLLPSAGAGQSLYTRPDVTAIDSNSITFGFQNSLGSTSLTVTVLG